jgi:hypothetical protein
LNFVGAILFFNPESLKMKKRDHDDYYRPDLPLSLLYSRDLFVIRQVH